LVMELQISINALNIQLKDFEQDIYKKDKWKYIIWRKRFNMELLMCYRIIYIWRLKEWNLVLVQYKKRQTL
jgi:hypothetical protein